MSYPRPELGSKAAESQSAPTLPNCSLNVNFTFPCSLSAEKDKGKDKGKDKVKFKFTFKEKGKTRVGQAARRAELTREE